MSYDFSALSKISPLKGLVFGVKRAVGRNSQGRITTRHKGGGVKRLYRIIDFIQRKLDVPAKVHSIEYDPNRTVRIARVHYADGGKSYILAPTGLKPGDSVIISEKTSLNPGNRMKLKNIPQGTVVHNIEIHPGGGGKVIRSAGSGGTVLAQDGKHVQIVMPSSEIRLFPGDSMASIGQLSNAEHSFINIGKAGRSRWKGIRPTVRGSVMNPVDHPYGGGEGKQPRGTKRPKSIYGKVTGGRKTRNKKKKSWKFIVRRRKK
ncbi:MAG: 50S ribosomal protein L2 [Parcubacteria group bacterium Licking1014_17]|nr:MAG: 50S ribosomal protein L2 [Parcubacteria group bacterium Licking1014_17]